MVDECFVVDRRGADQSLDGNAGAADGGLVRRTEAGARVGVGHPLAGATGGHDGHEKGGLVELGAVHLQGACVFWCVCAQREREREGERERGR